MLFDHAESPAISEYPRPQLRRSVWLSLNGTWEYCITDKKRTPGDWGSILVPYPPESSRSGVSKVLQPNQILWYRTDFILESEDLAGKLLLNFGAVDEEATISVNGHTVGRHSGGYESFSFDITEYCWAGKNVLSLQVNDSTGISGACRGKQSLKPSGIWYTSMSGIWQTVWLETVPKRYISHLEISPSVDENTVTFTVVSKASSPVTIVTEGHMGMGTSNKPITIKLDNAVLWTPENPKLYSVTVRMGSDVVESYYALRKCEIKEDRKGNKRLFLNGSPVITAGVLDQGVWEDTLYTPPGDHAMVSDIMLAKQLGFNTIRKHAKLEPDRWYWHCDRLGMMVWQDIPNGGSKYSPLVQFAPLLGDLNLRDNLYSMFGRRKPESRERYLNELTEIIQQLKNHPCIVAWVPFNEGWGQFDANKITETIRALDPERTIDQASGWHDQGGGDYKSRHVYFRKYRFKKDEYRRAVILSEFGGYSLTPEDRKIFSYRKFKNTDELSDGILGLFRTEIKPAVRRGLAGFVYTQLTDVETEENGLVTADRKTCKIKRRELQAEINTICNILRE